jgi:serine O-acetyltransferase
VVDRIRAALDRDPAIHGFWGVLEVVLTYAGFHALILHDAAHFLHKTLHIPLLPRVISQFARFITGVEIHPGAAIGSDVFIDHGMGVVIGETAEIGNGTTIFQGVTLGGTGKQSGKRHPTIGENVVIGVGAAVLGNVTVGDGSYIGAGAVVLKDVPPNSTAVGVPARMVRSSGKRVIGAMLDHTSLPDPILERLQSLQEELERAEEMIEADAALPHVLLAISARDRTTAREQVERVLEAERVSYAVHEESGPPRVIATLCERKYADILAAIERFDDLTVVSKGYEGDLRGESEWTPSEQLSEGEVCSGGRIMRLVIALTASED